MNRGRIPDDIIESVLKAHDIAEVVGRYVQLSKHGKHLKGLCPFHSEKTPSFTVTPELQIYKCFGCGAGGNVITFLRDIEGLTYAEAVRKLAEEANLAVGWHAEPDEPPQARAELTALLDAHELACAFYQHVLKHTEEGRRALDYLRNRGIGPEAIETFRIGYAPARWDALVQLLARKDFDLALMEQGGLVSRKNDGSGFLDKFRDRVMFPIFDAKGRIVAFGGRLLGEGQPKYLNSPETKLFTKSGILYNLHQARPQIRKDNTLVLFEGYVDAIQGWEAGEWRGVATLGTSLTQEHAQQIRRLAEHVVICYDGDNAGREAAFKSLELLESFGCAVRVALLPDGLDPDEYIRERGGERFCREIVDGAVPAVKYRLLYFRKNFRLQEEDGRLRYLRRAVQLLASLDSATEREHYVRELASEFAEYGVTADSLRQDVNEARMRLASRSREDRDNPEFSWNNVRNNAGTSGTGATFDAVARSQRRSATILDVDKPDYWNAERQLLAVMMHDADVALYVRERVGEAFNVEEHAALAAYLYAYYAKGHPPDPTAYMATLQDPKLEAAAADISLMGAGHGTHPRVIDDYIRQILDYPLTAQIREKREAMIRAERAGDILAAARIASEIISLERRWKAVPPGNV